ncbi:MAG: TonB-dependent receptor [Ignavibacteriaceae bacterium]|nr:TonB-dependent receptor [Ignavibacteriaceae bacterium]
MKYILTLVITASQLFAQGLQLSGKITDAETKAPLASANILLNNPDSALVKGTTSSKTGTFHLTELRAGVYTLLIKYIGYKDFTQEIVLKNNSIDLGTIALIPGVVSTDEVTVTGKLPIATQSGDTTIFDARSFKVNKDAVAEDLLKKIPGIQVEDGKLKAQGEEVKKVYVDGKNFMGDDPKIAVKNLPADIIDKIQVFDQQSEQSQFTGFNDGNTTKAINLQTTLQEHKGIFGKFFAGGGTNERFSAGGNYNRFVQDQRLSILGQLNNTNEQNFTPIDMVGAMGIPSEGGMRVANALSDFFQGARTGDVTTQSAGVNYNDLFFDVMETGGSYFFNNTKSDLSSSLRRNFLNTLEGVIYDESGNSLSKNRNHRVNATINLKTDSINQLRFIPSFSTQENSSSSATRGTTYSAAGPLNYTNNSSSSNLSAAGFNGLLLYRRKFNTAGRTFSFSLNGSTRTNGGTRKNYSESVYYTTVSRSDTINQSADIDNKSNSLQGDLNYTDRLGKSVFLMVTGSALISNERNDRETFNYDPSSGSFALFDTLLSNVYERKYTNYSAGASVNHQTRDFGVMGRLTYNYATLLGGGVFPLSFSVKKNFFSFQPSLNINFRIAFDKNLSVSYRTSANAPSVTQLQNVIDNSNPLQLTTGNPSLKQEYTHNLSLRFLSTNYIDASSFFFMLGASARENRIGTSTIFAERDTLLPDGIFLNAGSRLSYPENYNGFLSLISFANYGIPVDLISSTVNFSLRGNYSNIPGTLNGIYNIAKSYNYGAGLSLNSNISQEIDFSVSTTSFFNSIRNSTGNTSNSDYFSQSTSFRFYWLAFERITLSADLTHRYEEKLDKPSSLLLNFNVGVKLFENRKGELKFSVFDALNQNNNNSKTITESYVQEYSTNLIGRYYLATFVYNLSIFM